MLIFFEYGNLIFFGIAIVSAFRMWDYLHYRKKEKSVLFKLNPLFFLDYITLTKKETGKTGLWFKIFIVSLILTLFFGIVSEIYSYLNLWTSLFSIDSWAHLLGSWVEEDLFVVPEYQFVILY